MGIPVGKLALYTACAGVNPQKTLPVCIDVGTNNEELLNDPLYMGLRQKRITGPEYDALIAEFVDAVRERWPNVVIQFEDFHNSHAYDLLDQYKDKVPCFNDDIQGTASVVVTGMFSAMRALKQQLKDQKVLFLGAGSAATGIAHLIADAMVEEGLTREEALARIKLFDSKGLVTKKRTAPLTPAKMPFAAEDAPAETFLEAIREIKPVFPPKAAHSQKNAWKKWLRSTNVLSFLPFPTPLPRQNAQPKKLTPTLTDAASSPAVLRSNLLNTKEKLLFLVRATITMSSLESVSALFSPVPN